MKCTPQSPWTNEQLAALQYAQIIKVYSHFISECCLYHLKTYEHHMLSLYFSYDYIIWVWSHYLQCTKTIVQILRYHVNTWWLCTWGKKRTRMMGFGAVLFFVFCFFNIYIFLFYFLFFLLSSRKSLVFCREKKKITWSWYWRGAKPIWGPNLYVHKKAGSSLKRKC